ncbi:hypothetical protein IQ07DRAFT_170286 [Pyrenochaeta sp. DS3sAY3a]|nr:hypothetical protein IQ07DRAFT_170286 [Pyrenochaeta sp. DS3sAY3a]
MRRRKRLNPLRRRRLHDRMPVSGKTGGCTAALAAAGHIWCEGRGCRRHDAGREEARAQAQAPSLMDRTALPVAFIRDACMHSSVGG